MFLALLCVVAVVTFGLSDPAFASSWMPWTPVNGPLGAYVKDVAIHPANSNVMLSAVNGGGQAVYRSTDGGRTWREAFNGVTSVYGWAVYFDPADQTGNTAYAITLGDGLLRSEDAGNIWEYVESSGHKSGRALAFGHNDPTVQYYASRTEVLTSRDGGSTWNPILSDIDPWSIATSPADDNVVWVGTWGEGTKEIFRSTDGGATWSTTSTGLPDANVNAIVPMEDGTTVYAATDAGIFKSVDGGDTWSNASMGLTNLFIRDLVAHPDKPQTLYTATDAGVFATVNAGLNWQTYGSDLVSPYVKSLAVDPNNSEHIVAGHWDGVAQTNDKEWQSYNEGLPQVASVALGTLSILPEAPYAMIAGTWGGGIYRGTWSENTIGRGCSSDPCLRPPDAWLPISGNHYTSMMNSGFAQNAVTAEHVFIGTDGSGVLRSADGGNTFEQIGPNSSNIWEIAVGNTPNVLYVSTPEGSYSSSDYGSSWELIQGLSGDVTNFVFHPNDNDTIFAAIFGGGVIHTTDGGLNWTAMNTGLTDLDAVSLAIDPIDPNLLFVSTDGAGLFRSNDGGDSWEISNGGVLDDLWINFLLTGVSSPGTVYAATNSNGIYRSLDSGASWSSWNDGLPLGGARRVTSLVFCPECEDTIYIGTASGVYMRTIPEPGTILLLSAGLIGLVGFRRKFRKK